MAVALQARREFEAGACDRRLLGELYRQYNPAVGDSELFVTRALSIFPRLNCGLASLYLRHQLQAGEIIRGTFRSASHTVLVADAVLIDITADQFGGPAVYVGKPVPPWRLPWSEKTDI
ncbi:hypothetical protein [Chelativorans salis]|uniref:Uncharacterized protein n=1 Tax=Chelativorans salis TaxID=2978478 RepID=A0ABT2LRQ5_9HYPH|nr:hypothetical protein [Chelativorans sp. EGI FJ00035]MCT7376303.1 hypothetical protein [Chelativorans sp. EGI FJ00035]